MRAHASNPRAFSIIELLTIVVILGVLAGVTLPRLVGQDRRAAERELEAVEDLLSHAAARESRTSAPLAVEYDEGTLRIVTLRAPEELTPWSGPGTWVADPLVRPVRLDRLSLATASASGQTLADDRWRIDLSTIEARPGVALGLEDELGRSWVVWLAPEAARATTARLHAGIDADDIRGEVVDLDEQGREDDPW